MNNAKKSKPIDLSEYEEEAVPFTAVLQRLAKAKPEHSAPHKPARKLTAAARKK